MLGTMATFGAGRDSPSPLPLALTFSPADGRSGHLPLHQNPLLHHPHSLLHGHPVHPYPDPIRRLALARLPPPRRPASGPNPKPFTSFCIKDILGGESERDEDSTTTTSSSPSSAPRTSFSDATSILSSPFKTASGSSRTSSGSSPTTNNTSNNHNITTTATSGTSGGKIRGTSRSPTNLLPPSKGGHRMSPRMPPSVAVPRVHVNGARIVRPWDPSPSSPGDADISSDDGVDVYQDSAVENEEEEEEEEEISVDDEEPSPTGATRLGVSASSGKGDKSGVSPLDALMAMTSKTFEGLDAPDSADARRRDQAALFGKHAPPKKRRKSRTAFSNQQIYELEKRFLYQKYLTPADRDEIAHSLGLTNAQVITWFQNRRAKLKRDLEELKNDVTAARKHPVHKTLIGTVAEMQLRRVHEEVLQKAAAEARRAERERLRAAGGGGGAGESVSTPPSSPSSSSATTAAPNSCCPSPSPLPLISSSSSSSVAAAASGQLSPTGSCHSNTTCSSSVSASNNNNDPVCNLAASNNNHHHHNHHHHHPHHHHNNNNHHHHHHHRHTEEEVEEVEEEEKVMGDEEGEEDEESPLAVDADDVPVATSGRGRTREEGGGGGGDAKATPYDARSPMTERGGAGPSPAGSPAAGAMTMTRSEEAVLAGASSSSPQLTLRVPPEVKVKDVQEGVVEEEEEVGEVDMDTSEEPENLSLKSARS
ncbi:uncharacterized protein LOC143294327 [Babylonia areolata]|uniref:uncharacterized protein LOC143294327 n=1 Tax=Babylonia areolata TaxID=304850 RepID=UPI003FD0A456